VGSVVVKSNVHKLVLSKGKKILGEFVLSKEIPITIGRHPESTISFDDKAVSLSHACVLLSGEGAGKAVVKDLGSKNGTRVNGEDVTACFLRHGDVIKVGQHKLRYFAAQDRRSSAAAKLVVMSGPDSGSIVDVVANVTPIGEEGGERAAIKRRPQGFVIVHLWGERRPRVNGQPIGLGSHPLHDQDVIEVADRVLQFMQDG
jgi:hypothetical protein